jgi:hypothetical protein
MRTPMKRSNRKPPLSLYFHDDFDGIASAVVAARFLRRHCRSIARFRPVDYELKDTWVSTEFRGPFAVADFLHHPDAEYWWDHHATTFSSDQVRAKYRNHPPERFWDPTATSCARMMHEIFAAHGPVDRKVSHLVGWADRIDSARYESPNQAFLAREPALRINLSLLARPEGSYRVWLVQQLLRKSLKQVASLAIVRRAYEEARERQEDLLKRFRRSVRLQNGTAVFEITLKPADIFNRYLPYVVIPKATFSIGVLRSPTEIRLTSMVNPWTIGPAYNGPHLGNLFSRFGGGGHQRVAGLTLGATAEGKAKKVVAAFLKNVHLAPARKGARVHV